VVLDVTARDLNQSNPEQQVLFSAQKKYFEIGKDLQGRMRYGAWQIKEIVDLTLQPMQVQKERFLLNFDTDIEEVEITVTLSYYVSGKSGGPVHTFAEKISYDL
jgi:hypothetical protein